MKEVTWRVPSSTVVWKERRRERKRNVGRLEVKDDVVSRRAGTYCASFATWGDQSWWCDY
jgi:hypothetical protein